MLSFALKQKIIILEPRKNESGPLFSNILAASGQISFLVKKIRFLQLVTIVGHARLLCLTKFLTIIGESEIFK